MTKQFYDENSKYQNQLNSHLLNQNLNEEEYQEEENFTNELPSPSRRSKIRHMSRSRSKSSLKRITKAMYLQRKMVFDREQEAELIIDPITYFNELKIKTYDISKECKTI